MNHNTAFLSNTENKQNQPKGKLTALGTSVENNYKWGGWTAGYKGGDY